jgi:hypothetical protein
MRPDLAYCRVFNLAFPSHMITCYLRYIIDPFKAKEFEHYGKTWIPLVVKFGG